MECEKYTNTLIKKYTIILQIHTNKQNQIWSMKSATFEIPIFQTPNNDAYTQYEYANAYNFGLH